MDKYKCLLGMIKEVPNHAPELKRIASSVATKLGKVYKSDGAYDALQEPLNAFLRSVQIVQHKVGFPKHFFVKLYGSVLEFDKEYSQIRSELQANVIK